MKNFKVHKQTYRIKETFMYVLYEYDEFLERLFFQYKEQRDIVLKDVFLNSHKYLSKTFKHYCVCSLCSSDAKRMERGFEPVVDIYATLGVFVHSPFYKKENVKQSSKSRLERAHIKDVLALKEMYPLPKKKKILLVDDVCTTGNTLYAALDLIHPDYIFVIAAHPLWIKANKENIVVKSNGFW
ncbi:ComF family protein [Holdemanella biformis]